MEAENACAYLPTSRILIIPFSIRIRSYLPWDHLSHALAARGPARTLP